MVTPRSQTITNKTAFAAAVALAVSLLLAAFAVPAKADIADAAAESLDPGSEVPASTEAVEAVTSATSAPESAPTVATEATPETEAAGTGAQASATPESAQSESLPTPAPAKAPVGTDAIPSQTARGMVDDAAEAATDAAAEVVDSAAGTVDEVGVTAQSEPVGAGSLPLEPRVSGLVQKVTGDAVEIARETTETLKEGSTPELPPPAELLSEVAAPILGLDRIDPGAGPATGGDLLASAATPTGAAVEPLPAVPPSIASSPPPSETLRGGPIEASAQTRMALAGPGGTGFDLLGSWPASAASPKLTPSMAVGDAIGLTVRGTFDASSPNRSGGPPPPSDPVPAPGPPALAASGSGASFFIPFAALLALLALAAQATLRRLGEVPAFSVPTPFVCALERPG